MRCNGLTMRGGKSLTRKDAVKNELGRDSIPRHAMALNVGDTTLPVQ